MTPGAPFGFLAFALLGGAVLALVYGIASLAYSVGGILLVALVLAALALLAAVAGMLIDSRYGLF